MLCIVGFARAIVLGSTITYQHPDLLALMVPVPRVQAKRVNEEKEGECCGR